MVHRDVKPHNLLVSAGRKTVKILDLGLARLEADPLQVTKGGGGVLLGTPAYLSPEQGKDPLSADARSDIYSLGCTLYHLLTGRVPFRGESAQACAEQHRTAVATPVEDLRPELPEGLAEIVRKMMAREPADRYAGAAEVAVALGPFCGTTTEIRKGLPEQAQTSADSASNPSASTLPSITLRPSAWSGLSVVIMGFLGIFALLTLGLAAGGIWPFNFSPPPTHGTGKPIPVLNKFMTGNSAYLVIWRGDNQFTAIHETEGSLKVVVDGKIVKGDAVADSVEIVSTGKKLNAEARDEEPYVSWIRYLLQRAEEKFKHALPPPNGVVPKHWHRASDREDVHSVAMPMKPYIELSNGWSILLSQSLHKWGVYKTLAASMPPTDNPELLFRNSRNTAMKTLRGRLEFEKFYKFGSFPAYEAHVGLVYADGQRGTEYMRLYLVGNHVIYLHAQGTGSIPNDEVVTFFQSFALLPRTRFHGGVHWQGRTVSYRTTAHADAVVSADAKENELVLRVTSDGQAREIVILPTGAEYAGQKFPKDKWTTLRVQLDDAKADFSFDQKDAELDIKPPFKTIPTITLRPDRRISAAYADELTAVDITGQFEKGMVTPLTITFGPPQKSATVKTLEAVPAAHRDLVDRLITRVETLSKDYRKAAKK